MKTKLIFCSGTSKLKQWTILPFVPRIGEYFNVKEILRKRELKTIMAASDNWHGVRGIIQSVEYRCGKNDFYVEVEIFCGTKL
jgi:hypothetical protein